MQQSTFAKNAEEKEKKKLTWNQYCQQMACIKNIEKIPGKLIQKRLKQLFVLERRRDTIHEQFKAEMRELKTFQFDRKSKILEKRDKILAGEMADDLMQYEN